MESEAALAVAYNVVIHEDDCAVRQDAHTPERITNFYSEGMRKVGREGLLKRDVLLKVVYDL